MLFIMLFRLDFVVLGGKGNYYFLSNMNRAPTEYELGAIGDKKKYKLELQLIAHFGLVRSFTSMFVLLILYFLQLGFPNAGKSSLLRTISRARPIVGDYEFTTRQPQLGSIEYDDFIQIHGLTLFSPHTQMSTDSFSYQNAQWPISLALSLARAKKNKVQAVDFYGISSGVQHCFLLSI